MMRKEFKDIMKKARRKLEIPMPAAMPCITSLCRRTRKSCRAIGGHKTKYACTVEADELYENSKGKSSFHEDLIAGKGANSLSHYDLLHNFIPMPQSMKIQDAKEEVDKRMGNVGEKQHGS